MTPPSTLRGYDRAEAAWLSQPENRLTDEHCDLCGHEPCSCDEEYEAYRDRLMDEEYDR